MADKPKPVETPAALPMSEAKREKRVVKLSTRVGTLERAIDVVLRDQEDLFNTYVAYYNGARPSQAIHVIPAPYPDLAAPPPHHRRQQQQARPDIIHAGQLVRSK